MQDGKHQMRAPVEAEKMGRKLCRSEQLKLSLHTHVDVDGAGWRGRIQLALGPGKRERAANKSKQ